jgi:hypothetical protein
MKTKLLSTCPLLLGTVILLATGMPTRAQTLISGNVSGTWTAQNSPYVVVDHCTVPAGQTLTIQPGVTVIIGSGLSIVANGRIVAVGSPTERITVRAPNDTTFWDRIQVNFSNAFSHFEYCDFIGARNALWFDIDYQVGTMTARIENCRFVRCSESGVYGRSRGSIFGGVPRSPTLSLTVINSHFESSLHGCHLHLLGHSSVLERSGGVIATIRGNIFVNLTGSALELISEGSVKESPVSFVNNTIVNAARGVHTRNPFDVEIQNNIFVSVRTAAVERTGTQSSQVGFNAFHGNEIDFTGYPTSFGTIVFENRNGTPTDVAFNIFSDPLFVSETDFRLGAGSPAIDAGAPGAAFNDVCFPPSQGTEFNDLGAYGGPAACEWVSNAPPVIAPIQNREVNEGELLTFTVIATDPDVPPQTLSFSLINPPEGARIDSALGIFTWIPSEAQGPGAYSITVQVNDGNLPVNGVAAATFTVLVNEVNSPPIVDPIENRVIQADIPLTFTVSAIDLDRPVIQTLTFSLDAGAPAGATIHSQTGVFSWTPTDEQAGGEHEITVRVTDNGVPPMSSTATFRAVPAGKTGELKLAVRRDPGGDLLLQLEGAEDGAEYNIETATELKPGTETTPWTVLRTFRWQAGAGLGEAIEIGSERARFYRLVRTR